MREVQTFWGIGNFFFPTWIVELDLLFVQSTSPYELLLKQRTETAWSCVHTCNTCFISKDEVELQQDEENLPYEEEIYKDSSTFLKVSCFCNWKCSQSWPSCLELFLQLWWDLKYSFKGWSSGLELTGTEVACDSSSCNWCLHYSEAPHNGLQEWWAWVGAKRMVLTRGSYKGMLKR